jgi:hypothetical protein
MASRLGAVAVVAAAVLLFAACTDSGYNYVKNSTDAGSGTYFKVPSGWKIYEEGEFFKTRDLSPVRTKLLRETSWTVAFDASANPSLKHYDQLVPRQPFGLARVRELDPEERNAFSIEAMRNLVVPIDAIAQQGAEVDILRMDEFTQDGGFRGLRLTFSLQPPENTQFVTFDQVSIVDSETKELHLMFISCSANCYERNKDTINTVMDSWTVKER